MERAGEGMVAIFQGTKQAGLRVTLVPNNNLLSKRQCVLMDLGVRPPMRLKHSSVETNTEWVFQNASVPMCDVRYASSYQFVNCKAVKSSFHVSDMKKHSIFFKPSDQFADSLRKYPAQASSEILQRLINYSNIKQNTSKQNLKNIPSLLRKTTSQQTTRRYKKKIDTINDIYGRKPLNKSFSTIGTRYSSQKELLNYTYDYLKSISLVPRSTDVRYLTEVKRCIRNRLLGIFDDKPAINSRIRSRYSHHKRYCHGSAARPTPNKNEIQETKCAPESSKNTSNSSRRLDFFSQLNRCDCISILNKHSPLENPMNKLCPGLNVNTIEIEVLPKIQVPEDFTNKPYDADEEITSAVLEWLKTIPVYSNFSEDDKIKQKELILKLEANLRILKDQVDFISKAKKEIMLCVNDLPMWYPPYLNDKEQFTDQIVADLLKRLINVLENDLRYKVGQVISNLSYTENVDTEKIVDDFVNQIKSIVFHLPEDEKVYMHALKSKILDLLQNLPTQYTTQKLHDVANKLVKQLIKSFEKENDLKYCKSVPESEDIDIIRNNVLKDDPAKNFKYQSQRRNDEFLREELVKSIRIWLEDAVNTLKLRLNSKTKNRLSNKMADFFLSKEYNNSINQINNNSLKKGKPSEISTSQDALESLLKWYYSIEELVDERAETKKAIYTLLKELNEIQSRDKNSDSMLSEMKEIITVWLQNMLKKRGKHLDSKFINHFVNKLISILNVIPKRKEQELKSEYGQLYRDIVSWIKNIPYIKPGNHLTETKEIEKFVNQLINEGSDIESTRTEAVRNFIKSLSENLPAGIQDEDLQILKDELFKLVQNSLEKRKRWYKTNDLCQSILSEFSHILQTSSNLKILDNIKLNNINNKFYEKCIEHIEQNGLPNWNYLLQQLKNIFMQETKFEKYECKTLAKNVIARLQRRFSRETTRRSTILSLPVKTYVEPTRIIKHYLDATQKYRKQKNGRSCNDSDITRAEKNRKRRYHRKMNLQAGDGQKIRKLSKISIIYNSSNSKLDTHDSVDYNDNNNKISEDQNHNSALNKYKEYQTSTVPSAEINNFPIALDVIVDTQKALLDESKLLNKNQFLLELKSVIRDWIKSIDPNTNNINLDNLVVGIASDIIDRQKYLQLSQTNYSENNELEHLKYQMFRMLIKLKKYYLWPQIMSKINNLYRIIKKVSVPDLIKPINESGFSTTSGTYNSIFNKIRHWLDSVSSNLLKTSNINQNPLIINDLVQKIINGKNNNQYDYEMETDILLWLQNILRNCNDNIFHKLADDLKCNLQNMVLYTSNVLIKDNSELIDDNIFEAIVEWLQTTPFHKSCTLEEQDLQKKLALLLSTNLRKILQARKNEADNLNDQLKEEIQKYLKTIPIPAEFRNNIYYYKAAGELVEYLKQMITKFSETNTENDDLHFNDLVQNIIHSWCDNLPIHLGHSSESKEQAQKLKQNIATRLSEKVYNINQKEPNNDIDFEIMLSNEINKILNNVPMNRELERGLPVLKSILIDKLKQARNQIENLVPIKILHDTLTETLQELENTPDLEQTSLNLLKEKLADAFINLHYQSSTDLLFRDKLKEELYNEINRFCNAYLERYPYSPIDTDELRFNLYAILRTVPIPNRQHPSVCDEPSKSSFKKEVALKNATTHYSSPQFLPSTLSNKGRVHLETLRKRAKSYLEMANFEGSYKNRSPHEVKQFKNVRVLTDCTEKVEENVQTSKILLPETSGYSKEVLPQMVIKEFYWDSTESKQSLPPALTPHKIKPPIKETNDSQIQTETNLNNNSTKVNISRKILETRTVCNNKFDKASEATSQVNNENQEQVTNTYLKSTVQGTQNNKTVIIPKESNHRQQQTEKPFHQYHRKRDIYPDRVFDNGARKRYWIEQPRIFDDVRYIRQNGPSSYLEDSFKTLNDRRMLTQRICLTPENRNKENMCCHQNIDSNCRNGESACRRRCTSKYCSKCCCGVCPHPTMALFKKTF